MGDSPIPSSEAQTTPSLVPTPAAADSPRTYVLKLPKDRVYRVPPPENALKFNQISQPKTRRSNWCCWFFGILFILITLLAITAAIFYLVVRPKSLQYSIDSIDIRGFNSTPILPEFDLTINAINPNGKIGFRYLKDSSVAILLKDTMLCKGVLPEFYQPVKNVTVLKTALKGDVIKAKSSVETELVTAKSRGKVTLTVKMIVPLKVKLGTVETGEITVKHDCDVTIGNLGAGAKIISNNCHYSTYVLWSIKI